MIVSTTFAAVFAATGMSTISLLSQDPCSTTGGHREGSPGAVLAGIRNLSDGGYAACVERRREAQPVVTWSTAQVRDVARRAVLNGLIEPSSAVFQNVRRIPQSRGTTFCGEVSARTARGGMGRFKRFHAVVSDRGEASAQYDSSELLAGAHFDDMWANYCEGGSPVTF